MAKGLELQFPFLEGNERTADEKGSESFIATFMVAWRVGGKNPSAERYNHPLPGCAAHKNEATELRKSVGWVTHVVPMNQNPKFHILQGK